MRQPRGGRRRCVHGVHSAEFWVCIGCIEGDRVLGHDVLLCSAPACDGLSPPHAVVRDMHSQVPFYRLHRVQIAAVAPPPAVTAWRRQAAVRGKEVQCWLGF